jgi:hypothetical protein
MLFTTAIEAAIVPAHERHGISFREAFWRFASAC